jgi:hypothetical protein
MENGLVFGNGITRSGEIRWITDEGEDAMKCTLMRGL